MCLPKEAEIKENNHWLKNRWYFLVVNSRDLTLALFVLGGGANDHYPAVAANHPALLTHFLD